MADAGSTPSPDRRAAVLESAVRTFSRSGFRATSMNTIAAAAAISRPGLYFLFASKEALFREAVAHALTEDLREIERILSMTGDDLADRLVGAFDRWAGRYVGPLAEDVPVLIAAHADLLDDTAAAAPARFESLLGAAIAAEVEDPRRVTQTLISVSIGLKQQVRTREDYLDRLSASVRLVLR